MAHSDVMKILAQKGTQPNKDWGKILKEDMKLDKKEDKKDGKNNVKMKKDILKNCVGKMK